MPSGTSRGEKCALGGHFVTIQIINAMVKNQRLNQTFAALADPIRRGIVEQLSHGEATVGDLARPYKVSAPAISRHLRVLERAGLLERKIEGRVHRCRLRSKPIEDAEAWIGQQKKFWEHGLDRLAALLDSATEEKH